MLSWVSRISLICFLICVLRGLKLDDLYGPTGLSSWSTYHNLLNALISPHLLPIPRRSVWWASHFYKPSGGETNADEMLELTRLCSWWGTQIINPTAWMPCLEAGKKSAPKCRQENCDPESLNDVHKVPSCPNKWPQRDWKPNLQFPHTDLPQHHNCYEKAFFQM